MGFEDGLFQEVQLINFQWIRTVADPGGAEGAMAPPSPVRIGHKKDGRRRWPHRFHVSRPPPYPVAGSATVGPGWKMTLKTQVKWIGSSHSYRLDP